MNRIRSLDGLRAISIIMVIIGHSYPYLPRSVVTTWVYQTLSNSTLGVSIFFVISGYLITKLLIIEKEKTGSINFKHFYIRRVLRIFPIFYLYILLLIILKLFFVPDIINNYAEITFAALYLWNYKQLFIPNIQGNAETYLGHYWSLAMEEQFYFIWPIMFSKIKKEKLIKVVIAIILLMPFLRIATYFLMPGSRGQIHSMIQTGGDTILIGCLGALIEGSETFQTKYLKYLKNNFLIAFSILFLFVFSRYLTGHLGGAYTITVGQSLNNVFILIFLFWCIYVPTKFSVFLNSKVLVHIGIISYSIYIWHKLILANPNSFLPDNLFVKILLIFLAGFVSYYFIEKPILKLKNKFKDVSIPKTQVSSTELINEEGLP